ncbi:MAG: hypothetical protein CTY12_01505 [Methylotenera sp.]|nr:MAG: hypothetical protein CTY12_01505 [Methylotenera sp.]
MNLKRTWVNITDDCGNYREILIFSAHEVVVQNIPTPMLHSGIKTQIFQKIYTQKIEELDGNILSWLCITYKGVFEIVDLKTCN